jgi:hypothetical protein
MVAFDSVPCAAKKLQRGVALRRRWNSKLHCELHDPDFEAAPR